MITVVCEDGGALASVHEGAKLFAINTCTRNLFIKEKQGRVLVLL